MAKVGRAARVASRQRVETVTGNKTIASAETGELYLVSAAAVITLPAVQDGAYFKFILVDAISAATAFRINAAGSAKMKGAVASIVKNNSGAATVELRNNAVSDGSAATHIKMGDASHNVEEGTVIECFCDGTNWIVTGTVMISNAAAKALFA